MKYLPEHLIEYVIYHEITHIIEKRHSQKFWSIISKRFNNYRDIERDLFGYWFLIQSYQE
jgi:predicted metal-dependent hydrolase